MQIVQTHFKVVLKETGQGFGMPGGSEDCLESRIGFALRRVTKFTSSHVHLIENSLIQTYVCVCIGISYDYIYTYIMYVRNDIRVPVRSKVHILPTSDAHVTKVSQHALRIEVKRYRRYRNRYWIHWMLLGIAIGYCLLHRLLQCIGSSSKSKRFQPRPDFPNVASPLTVQVGQEGQEGQSQALNGNRLNRS